ncbi:MAG TPA: nuclear transport factor 2 family protein [Blastocatellia bacterium]|nr:nuclear transport factor 2 family protein [Blastocatellia bacterium]
MCPKLLCVAFAAFLFVFMATNIQADPVTLALGGPAVTTNQSQPSRKENSPLKRKLYFATLLLLVMLFAACGAAPVASSSNNTTANKTANGNDEQILLQLEREATQAMIKNDPTWLERNLDEKSIYTGGDNTVLTKSQLIEIYKAKDWHYDSAISEDIKVQLFGDTAIMTGWGSIKATYKGTPVNGKARFTYTLIKRQGQWQVIAGAEAGMIPAK